MSTENQIKKAIYEIYQWYLAQTEIIRVALLIIVIVLAGFSLIHILKAFVYVAVNFPVAIRNTASGLKKLFRLISWPFRLIFKILKWIIKIPSRIKHYFEVKKSKFNVYPERFIIPFWRRLLSFTIRRESRTRFKCIEQAISTQERIDNNFNTYHIMLEAKVGGGKTLLTTLLSKSKTFSLTDKIDEKTKNTEKILYFIDFEQVKLIIESKYKEDTYIPTITDFILEKYGDYLVGNFNNYLRDVPYVKLMEDYIVAYCAKLRNNYVISNYTVYNNITKNFNYELDESLFMIKDPTAMKKYYLPAYSIILQDELTLKADKNTNSYQSIDGIGKDSFLRLIRHLKEETCCFIGNAQDTSREAKILRELANMYILIESMHVSGVQKSYSRIFEKKENKLRKKLKKANGSKSEKIKKKIFELYQIQNKIYAAGFIKFNIKIAYSLKELERWNHEELKSMELCFPMSWGFGTYKKCQYNDIDKYLNDKSKCSDSDLKEINDFNEKMDITAIKSILKSEEEIAIEKEKRLQKIKEAAKSATKKTASEKESDKS